MQVKPSRNLGFYLILTLVLSAVFLGIKYASDLKLTDHPEPEAAIASSGPVVRSPLPDSHEQRFRQLEQWLGQTQDAYEARFEQLEQRLAQSPAGTVEGTDSSTRPYETRLQQLEQRLGQSQDANESRFEQLERRLVRATASPSGQLQSTAQPRGVDLPEARLSNIEQRLAQTTSRLNELSDSLAALTTDPDTTAAASRTLRLTPPAAVQDQPLASAPPARPRQPIARAAPEINAPAEPEGSGPAASAAHGQGKWVINLASYVNEKTATRYMESFRKKGVAAELVSADVRGRTIYRVRIAGFQTMAAARAMAPAVEQQLGLKETWIMAN